MEAMIHLANRWLVMCFYGFSFRYLGTIYIYMKKDNAYRKFNWFGMRLYSSIYLHYCHALIISLSSNQPDSYCSSRCFQSTHGSLMKRMRVILVDASVLSSHISIKSAWLTNMTPIAIHTDGNAIFWLENKYVIHIYDSLFFIPI